jgi:hypothetical protein
MNDSERLKVEKISYQKSPVSVTGKMYIDVEAQVLHALPVDLVRQLLGLCQLPVITAIARTSFEEPNFEDLLALPQLDQHTDAARYENEHRGLHVEEVEEDHDGAEGTPDGGADRETGVVLLFAPKVDVILEREKVEERLRDEGEMIR